MVEVVDYLGFEVSKRNPAQAQTKPGVSIAIGDLQASLKSPVYSNSERLQFGDTSFCGHLCLYALKKLDQGFDFQTIISNLW